VDAHCPHLGAHLGYGAIVGDDIQCPFHGWQFDTAGKNTVIPFCDRPNSTVRLNHWTIAEQDGVILVWYDALRREPMWVWPSMPELADNDGYHPPTRHFAGIRKILPQQMFENGPDSIHFPFVHGAGQPAEITEWTEDYPFLHCVSELKFGVGKAPTWLTPNGPVVARIDTIAAMGMGMVRFSFEDIEMGQLVSITPVDSDHSMTFSTTVGKKDPSGGPLNKRTVGMMEYQHAQIERDFSIWENQVYVLRPPFSGPEERYFARFRRFVRAYYPDEPIEMEDVNGRN
jgi:hypothetical protein